MNKPELMNVRHGQEGYSLNLKLSASELEMIQKMIRMQWLYRLQLLVPEHVHRFDEVGIERYHELAHLIDHATVWPKTSRVLPREAISIFRKMDFFNKLESELGSCIIADEEQYGWENIYWRLVRPGNNDLGSLHADKWFWDIGTSGPISNFSHERLKIWIAIHTVSGKNGLRVVPGSHHKKDWQWHVEVCNNIKKPILDEPEKKLDLVLLPTEPGTAVVFHDELIHGGAPNTAETTRVSLEFTLLIPVHVKKKFDPNLYITVEDHQ